jgi:hypothetical protein
VDTCTVSYIYVDVGNSPTLVSRVADWIEGDDHRCKDCGILTGGFHHPGCVSAPCPCGSCDGTEVEGTFWVLFGLKQAFFVTEEQGKDMSFLNAWANFCASAAKVSLLWRENMIRNYPEYMPNFEQFTFDMPLVTYEKDDPAAGKMLLSLKEIMEHTDEEVDDD